MILDPIQILGRLVAIPSVNPMGAPAAGPEFGEARLTQELERLLRQTGLLVQRQNVAPDQDNLIARLDGHPPPECGGRLILFGAHQDTVPVAGMKIDPWKPEIRDGRLYGRGSCDTKGGMAAMLAAISRLSECPQAERPTVVMACTVNEEHGFTGASALVRLWAAGPQGTLPRAPDAAVIAEPTGLNVVVAHKGVVRWRCHARGRAAHSSRPDLGDNAIYKMGRALGAMERYQREVLALQDPHPLCGAGTFSVGTIRGGASVNTVPDRCTIEIDRRFPPGEDPEAAYREVVEYLARDGQLGLPLEHDPPYMRGLALSDKDHGPLADRLTAAAREVVRDCRKIGVPYATEAAFYAAAGVPAVVFGPGFLEQAHTDEEWVSVEQVRQAAEIYYRFARAPGLAVRIP
jgi:acetylornithine deacetylase/succinyl-diaminopimelate desuccinylase family protein